MPKRFKKTGLRRFVKRKKRSKVEPEAKPTEEVEPTKKNEPSYKPMGGKTGPISVIEPEEPEQAMEPEKVKEPVIDEPKSEEEEIDKKMEPIDTKDAKIEMKEDDHTHEEVVEEQVNPMQEFFDDMGLIMSQARDPYLRKPTFDVGGPVIQNYLLWLQLSELMKINKKLSSSVTEKLNKEEENA